MAHESDDIVGADQVPEGLDQAMRMAFKSAPLDGPRGDWTPGVSDELERIVEEAGLDDLHRYDILDVLGRGGMGVVLRALDRELDRSVAIKVIREDIKAPHLVERFITEARITSQLEHPGIVPVYDFGLTRTGRAWMSMRLVEGRQLKEVLEEGTQDQLRLVQVVQKVASAVACAHDRGVLHRDLKPSNVMIGRFGEVQVMDWGLARVHSDVEATERPVTGTPHGLETSAGSVVGSWPYMAPEQARPERDKIGPPTDVFALGVLLHTVLTGRGPYDDLKGDELKEAVRRADPARFQEILRDTEPELQDLTLRCLAEDPRSRPTNASMVATELDTWIQHTEEQRAQADLRAVQAAAELHHEKRLRKTSLLAAAVVLISIALAAFTYISKQRENEDRSRRAETNIATSEAEAEEHAQRARSATPEASLAHWTRALAAAQRAIDLSEGAEVSAGTVSRVAALKERLAQAESESRRSVAQAARRRLLSNHLKDLAGRQTREASPQETLDAYQGVAQELGWNLGQEDFIEIVEANGEEDMAGEFLHAWLLATPAADQFQQLTERLMGAIDQLDPDPVRARVRSFARAGDVEGLSKLFSDAKFLRDASNSTFGLALTELRTLAGDVRLKPILLRAWMYRPDDDLVSQSLTRVLSNLEAKDAGGSALGSRAFAAVTLALQPESVDAALMLLADYVRKGESEEALEIVDAFLDSMGEDARLLALKADTLERLGRSGEAKEYRRRAYALDPKNIVVLAGLINEEVKAGNLEAARGYARTGAELPDRRSSGMLRVLADLEAALGDSAAAFSAVEKAIAQSPNITEYRRRAVTLAQAAGHPRRALDHARECVRRSPEDGSVHRSLMKSLLWAERWEEAEAHKKIVRAELGEAAADVVRGMERPLTVWRSLRQQAEALKLADDGALPENFVGTLDALHNNGMFAQSGVLASRLLDKAQVTDDSYAESALMAAASAAVRAARWHGDDEAMALELRTKAREWMSRLLDHFESLVGEGRSLPEFEASVITLALTSNPLGRIRDAEFLEVMSAEERAQFDALWRRVRALK